MRFACIEHQHGLSGPVADVLYSKGQTSPDSLSDGFEMGHRGPGG